MGRRSPRRAVGCAMLLAILGLAGVATGVAYHRDRAEAVRRVTGRSLIVPTRHGPMEYAEAGTGPPLLMIHGTGGGFDQGLAFADRIAGNGVRVIAPSRFGYLRSSWPGDPSSERQADAFVDLLDHLKLDKVAVAGGSAGALSAIQFALRHPERTTALILIVPAANVEGRDPNQMSPARAWVVRRLLTSDFLFWAARHVLAEQMIGVLLATDPQLVAQASPAERRRAYDTLDRILPISRRWRGMLNDGTLAGRPARVDFTRLRVPLLVLSADDDRFGTAPTARAIAGQVAGARLVIYPSGGHILVGRQEDSAAETWRFIQRHRPPTPAKAGDPAKPQPSSRTSVVNRYPSRVPSGR